MSVKKTKSFGALSVVVFFAVLIAIALFLLVYGSLVTRLISYGICSYNSFNALAPIIMTTAFILIDTQIFLMITRFVISKYYERRGQKRRARAILTLYTYVVWAFMIIVLVTSIFKDVGAILTSLGLIGFGVTFALQKPILNFVGWLTIVLTQPFTIGDRIEVAGTQTGSVRGDVVSIHTMYTRVQSTRPNTLERSEMIITIPNELILTNSVINYSRLGDVYWDDVALVITYESNWRKATEILQKAAEDVSRRYVSNGAPTTDEEMQAWHEAVGLLQSASRKLKKGIFREAVKEQIGMLKTAEHKTGIELPKSHVQMIFADSGINLNVLYPTDVRAVRASRHEVRRIFLEEIEKHNDIKIAYPHMQIIYDNNPKERRAEGIAKKLSEWSDAEEEHSP